MCKMGSKMCRNCENMAQDVLNKQKRTKCAKTSHQVKQTMWRLSKCEKKFQLKFKKMLRSAS